MQWHFAVVIAFCRIGAAYCDAPIISDGLAPKVTDLIAEDVSYKLEQQLPYLAKPFIASMPAIMNDGIAVGELGRDGGDKDLVLKYAEELARQSNDETAGKADSLLISYRGNLIFEAYFRRG